MIDLISGLVKTVSDVPGVRMLEREIAGVERVVLRELQHRLNLIAPETSSSPDDSAPFTNGAQRETAESATLAETMERILRRSMDQTRADSRHALFSRILRALVPDEARIVSALADGSTYPLLEISVAQRGREQQTVLKNASSVGRAAGVADPSFTPAYVTHLMQLGVAEVGPEDSALNDEYDILLTESGVKSAHVEATAAGRRAARIVRRTVRISPLGREFWAACHIENEVG